MSCTSVLGPAQTVTGMLFQVGNNSSPEAFNTIANATDLTLPVKSGHRRRDSVLRPVASQDPHVERHGQDHVQDFLGDGRRDAP